MTAIVVVEDDPPIRAGLVRSLSARGYAIRGSANGLEGLSLIVDGKPDAVLLDLGLPDIDGLDLLRMIRAVSTVPVVVITVRDDDDQIVRTLDAGADDYVVKPFGLGLQHPVQYRRPFLRSAQARQLRAYRPDDRDFSQMPASKGLRQIRDGSPRQHHLRYRHSPPTRVAGHSG